MGRFDSERERSNECWLKRMVELGDFFPPLILGHLDIVKVLRKGICQGGEIQEAFSQEECFSSIKDGWAQSTRGCWRPRQRQERSFEATQEQCPRIDHGI